MSDRNHETVSRQEKIGALVGAARFRPKLIIFLFVLGIFVAVLGGITLFLRSIINPGYELGDRVADANERRHAAAQSGQ